MNVHADIDLLHVEKQKYIICVMRKEIDQKKRQFLVVEGLDSLSKFRKFFFLLVSFLMVDFISSVCC